MDEESVRRATEAVDNVAKYCKACVEHALSNVVTRWDAVAGHFERDAHNLVQSVRESANNEAVSNLKSTVVASCKRVSSGGWFLLSLAMGGILIARGEKKKCGRAPHPSICHCLQLQPPAFHFDQPLKRRSFCAQDIYDVESTITSFGSPHWEKTHECATKTAVVLETLKKKGATCIGKTVMSELGFSLVGLNRWFDIPKNPFDTYRLCGGSSSGAAVSVATNVAEFAMGWFAKSAGLLLLVGRNLCSPHSEVDSNGPKRFYMAQDMFELSSLPLSRTAYILSRSVQRTMGRLSLHDIELLEYFKNNIPAIQAFKKELDRMNIESTLYSALDVLRETMLLFHRYEFKSNHGEWIAKTKPQLTSTVETQVQRAVFTPSSEALRLIGLKVREELRIVMDTLLKDDAVLVVPVLPYLPPKLDASANELEFFEYQTHAFMSIATISGCCQVVIPVGSYGCPMSVSLLASKGADLLLLETLFLLHTTIQQEVLLTANPNLPLTAFIHQIRS